MIDVAKDNVELDTTCVHTMLGWNPRHSLYKTLPKMISGLKADPFAWYRENELKLPLWLKELMPAPDDRETNTIVEHPDELMQLAKQVQQEIVTTCHSNAISKSPNHDEDITVNRIGDKKTADLS